MNAPVPPPAPPSPPSGSPPPGSPAPAPAPRRKRRWLLFGCGGFLLLLLIIFASVAITLWWLQRPIKPVVLSPPEKAKVEEKLKVLEAPETARTPAPKTATPTPDKPNPNRFYVAGSKTLKLTEREINGLLNANTDLGHTVRLEFDTDAINAYIAVPIPQDFPIGGGKMFRARGRFRLSVGNGGTPVAVLEDVTVFGISLPKAWLGGIKGENLLKDAVGSENPIKGIKSLKVEPGALVLELED